MKRYIGWFGLIQSFIVLALLSFIVFTEKAKFQADILALLPQSEQVTLHNAEAHFFERNKTLVIISIAKDNPEQAYDSLQEQLKQQTWFNDVKTSDNLIQTLQFYLPYKGLLLSNNFSNAIQSQLTYGAYSQQKLSEVVNPFINESIAHDASLSVADFVEQAITKQSVLSEENGRLVSSAFDEKRFFIIFNVDKQALNVVDAIIVANEVKQLIASTTAQYAGSQINYSGVLFHTAENSSQAQFELSFFGGLSLLAMLSMVYFVFRTKKALLAVSLTIANALAYGFIVLVLLFDSVHIISLVFGVTLIGISIDYCFHIITEYNENTIDSEVKAVQKHAVKKSILLGFFTTALGYLLLTLAPISLFSQVAVFVVAGLAGAIIAVFTLLPLITFISTENNKVASLVAKLIGVLKWLQSRKTLVLTLFSLVVGLFFIATPLPFNDSIADLNGSSRQLIDNERLHKAALSQNNVSRLFIRGDSVESLLQKEEQVRATINSEYPEAKFTGITDWLPSKKRQKKNQNQLIQAVQSHVFSSWEDITGLTIDLRATDKVLSYQAIENSPVASYVTPYFYQDQPQGDYVSLLQVVNIKQNVLTQLITKYDGDVILFDKAENISQLMTESRQSLLFWFIVALAIFAGMSLIKFGAQVALNQILVLALSIFSALMLSYLIQGPLNLFNVLAMMLILALAIDYLIFYQYRGFLPSNVLAISLSALSSLFVFGILVFSNTPAVYSFGLTVMLGIASIFILAPLSVKAVTHSVSHPS